MDNNTLNKTKPERIVNKTQEEIEREEAEELKQFTDSWNKVKKPLFISFGICVAYFLLMLFAANVPVIPSLRNTIFLAICIFASLKDIKTLECPDYVHVMILLTALMNVNTGTTLLALLVSGIIVFIIFGVSMIFMKGNMLGGADVKFCAVATMMVGLIYSLTAVIIAMIAAIVVNTVKQQRIRKQTGEKVTLRFPLLPYLACGYTAIILYAVFF